MQACTIGVRYSVVRRQGFVDGAAGGADGAADARDASEWRRAMAALEAAGEGARVSLAERALEQLAGPDSPLRLGMLMAAETKERIGRLERQAAEQPAEEVRALIERYQQLKPIQQARHT